MKRNKDATTWLTTSQVAEQLGVSDDTVRAWIARGELDATNLAADPTKRKSYRVEAEAVARFITCRNTTAVPEPPRRNRTKKAGSDYFDDLPD